MDQYGGNGLIDWIKNNRFYIIVIVIVIAIIAVFIFIGIKYSQSSSSSDKIKTPPSAESSIQQPTSPPVVAQPTDLANAGPLTTQPKV